MEIDKVINIGKNFEKTREFKLTQLIKVQIIVTVISIIMGIVLHFTYDWSRGNALIGIFSAINESVWEHLKLVFFPMLISAIIEYFFVKDITNNYIEAKTIGIFTAMSFIVIFFFTYTGILGENFATINILTFIISIILGEIISYKLLTRENESTIQSQVLSILIIAFFFISFIVFTFSPPHVNLFAKGDGPFWQFFK